MEREISPVLTGVELETWRSFLRAHTRIMRLLEAELMAEHDLPLSWYDVLVQLQEADGRLRMTDLAERLLISRSGLTRLVDRMTAAGLLRREPVPMDARGTFAVLTPAGEDRLRTAASTHIRGVLEHVIDRLTPDQLRGLGAATWQLAPLDDRPVPAADDGEEEGGCDPSPVTPASVRSTPPGL